MFHVPVISQNATIAKRWEEMQSLESGESYYSYG
jgi:hypothetical protein